MDEIRRDLEGLLEDIKKEDKKIGGVVIVLWDEDGSTVWSSTQGKGDDRLLALIIFNVLSKFYSEAVSDKDEGRVEAEEDVLHNNHYGEEIVENGQFKFRIAKRETFMNMKLQEIVPKLPYFVKREIRTNYGSIEFMNIYCDADLLLKYLKELRLEEEKYERAKQKIEENRDMLGTGSVDLGLLGDFPDDQNILSAITGDEKDILAILSNHPNVLQEALVTLWFYTKPLPTSKSELKEVLSKIKRWDDTHHSGFGPIYECIWYQGWTNESREAIKGLAFKVRFVLFKGHWTLSSFEKRIDRAIEPIKTYLSQRGVGPKAEAGSPFSEKCLLCEQEEEENLIWIGVCEKCYEEL
ncbi:MAG: hypothetical protein QXH91_08530 [Candidatus Bathyarchaeia archaeon]